MKTGRKWFAVLTILVCLLFMSLGLAFVSCDNGGGTNTTYYTVTFNANGGSGTAPGQQKVQKGLSITLPDGSSLWRTDYTFDGWSTDSYGTGYNYQPGDSYTPTGDITLYARWYDANAIIYTVTFDANGGSGMVPGPIHVEADHGFYIPNNYLTRNGYTFGGWNTEPDGTGYNHQHGDSFTPTGDIILYARWYDASATLYTVTFNANGGDGMPPLEETVEAGYGLYIPYSYLTRDGYTFGGWNTEPDGTGINYQHGDYFIPTRDIILYARWHDANATLYTVTFDANGGDGTPPSEKTVEAGYGLSIPWDNPSRTGYTFGGWNTEPDGTGYHYQHGEYFTPEYDIILYAMWDAIYYTVTFYAYGGNGTIPDPITVQAGDSITLPDGSGITRGGRWDPYIFGGWRTDYDINYQPGDSFTPEYDITLYVKWDPAGSTDRIEYYWVDQHDSLVTTSGGETSISNGETLIITAQGDGYVVKQWRLNGRDTGQSGDTYNFSSTTAGYHTVGLLVEKDGKLYNTNITITVW